MSPFLQNQTETDGKRRPARPLRVGETIRHILADVFTRGDFRDPVLAAASMTIAEVRVSPDLRHATVFVSRLGRSDIADVLPALRRAAPYLRGVVARAMRQWRVTPDLRFQPDSTLDYASHVDALLRQPEVARDLGP